MNVLFSGEESLSAGWERNALPGQGESRGDVKTVSASRETGSQCHRSWIQRQERDPCDFLSEAGEIEMEEQCAGCLDSLLVRDVTGILKSADSQRNGILNVIPSSLS